MEGGLLKGERQTKLPEEITRAMSGGTAENNRQAGGANSLSAGSVCTQQCLSLPFGRNNSRRGIDCSVEWQHTCPFDKCSRNAYSFLQNITTSETVNDSFPLGFYALARPVVIFSPFRLT